MNDIIKAAGPEVAEASQLITLVPEKYVAEVFAPFKKSLTKAIKEAAGVTYDIQTKEGMSTAKQLRTSFKSIRTEAENTRKARKAPIIEIGKLLDARYKVLEAEIAPHEDKYDGDIKAEEKRIEEEKARKEAEERARVEAIENRIANIRNVPVQNMAAGSAEIVAVIDKWSTLVLDPADFQEYLEDAINAVNATLVELEKVRARAAEREAAEAKAEAERAELARLREESAKRDREAAEQRAQEEDRQRKAREAHEAEMQAMRDQMAKEKADMDRQRAQIEQERAALEAQKNPAPVAQSLFASAEGALQSRLTPPDDPDFLEVAEFNKAMGAPLEFQGIPESERLFDRRIPVVGLVDAPLEALCDSVEIAEDRNPMGRLSIMGRIDTIDQDGVQQHHPMALLIEFDSAEDIRSALKTMQCKFSFMEEKQNAA